MKPLHLAAPLLLLPLCGSAQGVTLNPIQVTAARMAQTADESLASVTIIDRERIERLQPESLVELLSTSAGISLSNNGGPGKESSLYLRGSESDHLLLLIDGVRVSSATSGKPALADLPLELIERIEIVRGPRSALYGSEAIGGVIQIFTRRGEGHITPSLSVGVGSDNSRRASAGVSAGDGDLWYSLAAGHESSDGIDALYGPTSSPFYVAEPDLDPYRNDALSMRVGYHFNDENEVEVHWLRSRSSTDFDGSFVNSSEKMQEVGGLRFNLTPHPLWQSTLQLGLNRDDSDNFKDGIYMSRFNSRRNSLSWQNDLTLGDGHYLIFGLDETRDSVESDTLYSVTSRRNSGAFVQLQGDYDAASLQLNLREDDNEQFGTATTGSLAWGYRLDSSLQLSASIGNAYKAPSFNELYYPGFGNANLRPERSQSIEFGLHGRFESGRWSLHSYRSEVSDLITTVCDINWVCLPTNVDRARLSGIEFEFERNSGPWHYLFNLTAQNPENRSGANSGKLLARRTQSSALFELDYRHANWSTGASLNAEGRRYDDAANTTPLDAYATLDLRASWHFGQDWLLSAKLANATDKQYETAAWYHQPGRSWLLTLGYRPGSR